MTMKKQLVSICLHGLGVSCLTLLILGCGGGDLPDRPSRDGGKSNNGGGGGGRPGPRFSSTITEARARTESQNNLKVLTLAMHNYNDAMRTLPPAAWEKNGKPLLSWRVLLLPYIEQNNLYKQFRLNEAWDSPHNKKLISLMPKQYALPGSQDLNNGTTHYVVPVGVRSAFERFPGGRNKGIRLTSIADGTANTILIVEGNKAIPWTKPEDLPFNPNGTPPKLGGYFHTTFHAAFADGQVKRIPNNVNPTTLKALITRNGGEVVRLDF